MIDYLEKYEMLTFDDITILFVCIIFVVLLAAIVLEIIYFIPSFMKSLVRSIKTKSLQDVENHDALETSLDLDNFKSMIYRKDD